MARFKKIYVEITSKCNLNCCFCKPWNDRGEMSVDNFKKLAKEVKNYSDYIYLHVKGEPLLHSQLNDILDICQKNNLKVVITTNSSLLTKKENILNEIVHQINVSLHSECIKDLNALAETCDRLSDNMYINYRIWISNNGVYDEEVMNFLKNRYHFDEMPENCKLAKNIYLSLDEEFRWPTLEDEEETDSYCLGTINQIGILADGTVVPCCLDGNGDASFGNVFDKSLAEILESEEFIKTNQSFKNNKAYLDLCKKCRFKDRFVL